MELCTIPLNYIRSDNYPMKTLNELLSEYIDNSSFRNEKIITMLKESFPEEIIAEEMKVWKTKSKHPKFIDTIDGTKKSLSPYLIERFEFCDKLVDASEHFYGINEISTVIKKPKFIKWLNILEEEWINSAPQLFSRDSISLFSTTNEDDGDYCLLIWKKNQIEPEIWKYSDQHEQIFKNLYDYFMWLNSFSVHSGHA